MLSYISNIIQDIYYGYVEIKCANPYCSQTFKVSRNIIDKNNKPYYSCNMGCALNSFNVSNIINENENLNEFIV